MLASITPLYAGLSALLLTWYDTITNLFLLLCQAFGVIYVEIFCDHKTARSVLKALRNDIITSSFSYKKGHIAPSGVILGKYCVGTIKTDFGDETIKLFGFKEYIMNIVTHNTNSITNSITNGSDLDDSTLFEQSPTSCNKKDGVAGITNSHIKIFNRYGDYKCMFYTFVKYPINNLLPRGDQGRVVDEIVGLYKRKKRGTVFLSGPSGTGKTIVGLLVAKEIGAYYTHDFKPSDPGDTLATLVSSIRSNDDDDSAPIVVVIEEADKLIENIHTRAIVMNNLVPTLVHDKSTFNTFLDDMMLYYNVILIMTSNKAATDINAMDASYLRPGRVHMCLTMTNEISCDE